MYATDVPVTKNGDTMTIGKSRLIIPGATLLSSSIMPASLSNGLVAYFPFNGNANDESASKNNGVINGAVLAKDRNGLDNSAISQTANGTHVRTQKLITNSPNNFSISLWVNPSNEDFLKPQGISGNEGTGVMSVIHPSHGSNWGSMSTNAGVGINVAINQVQIVEHTHLYISSPLVYNAQISGWHHIILVYDQHVPKLYLDGKLVATGLKSSIQNIHPSSGFCNTYSQSGFGNSFTPNGSPMGNFKGSYDEIRIYNRILTEEEILYLANN
jgi:hypothetical protein